MDIILLLYFFSILAFIRPRTDRSDYLSVNSALPIRGIMAIAIILHHMSEKINGGVLFPFMRHMGYLIVAVFFFLSGYGLMASYLSKGEKYLKDFWKKRVLYLLCVFSLVSIIYTIYHLIIGDYKPSLTIVANSWYVLIQILLYAIFWFSFSICKGRFGVLNVFVLQTILMFVLIMIGKPSIWYISNYGFSVGILWANNKEKIDGILHEHYWVCVIVIILGFLIFSLIPMYLGGYSICRLVSSAIFCVFVVLVLYKFKIVGKLWSWIGSISLEVYLLHGFVYMTLRHFVSNDLVWIIFTTIFSIIIAYFAAMVNKKIRKFLQ